jgi:hypothetical protein
MKLTGSQFQCLACGEHFAGPIAFGLHRTGQYESIDAECLSPRGMADAGMMLSHTGFWSAPQRQEAAA